MDQQTSQDCCRVYGGQHGPKLTLQAPSCVPAGILGQSMAAAFFGEAGLTEQEFELVSDAVQQVMAEQQPSEPRGNLAAAVSRNLSMGQHQQQQQPSVGPTAGAMQQPQQLLTYKGSAPTRSAAGGGSVRAQGAAGSPALGSMSEITAAEHVSTSSNRLCITPAVKEMYYKHGLGSTAPANGIFPLSAADPLIVAALPSKARSCLLCCSTRNLLMV